MIKVKYIILKLLLLIKKYFIDSELAIVTAISKKINFQQIVIVSDGIRWDMLLASINIIKNMNVLTQFY